MLNRVLLFFILFISFFSFSDNYIVNEEESVRFGLNTFFNGNDVSLKGSSAHIHVNSVGLEGYFGIPLAYDMFLNLGSKLEFLDPMGTVSRRDDDEYKLKDDLIYSLFVQFTKEFDINAKNIPYVHVGFDTGLNESNFNTVLGAGLVIPTNGNLKFNVALNYHYRSWYNLLNNVSDSGLGVTVGLAF